MHSTQERKDPGWWGGDVQGEVGWANASELSELSENRFRLLKSDTGSLLIGFAFTMPVG